MNTKIKIGDVVMGTVFPLGVSLGKVVKEAANGYPTKVILLDYEGAGSEPDRANCLPDGHIGVSPWFMQRDSIVVIEEA